MKARLDSVDWKILRELGENGRITNVELARRVGISAPPCLRRVRTLEDAGIIHGYRALLDEKSLGYDLTAFVLVGLEGQSEANILAFEERVRGWPFVRECYLASGEIDFIMRCVVPDLRAFQAFIIEELTPAPNVDIVRTSLVLRKVKDKPLLPVALA